MSARTIHYSVSSSERRFSSRRAHTEDLRTGLAVTVATGGAEIAKDFFHATHDAQCEEFPHMFVAGELRGAPSAFFAVVHTVLSPAGIAEAQTRMFQAMEMGLNVLLAPEVTSDESWEVFLGGFSTILNNTADSLVVVSAHDAVWGRNAEHALEVQARLAALAPVAPAKKQAVQEGDVRLTSEDTVTGLDTAESSQAKVVRLQTTEARQAPADAMAAALQGSTRPDSAVASEASQAQEGAEQAERDDAPLRLPKVAGGAKRDGGVVSASNRAARQTPRRLGGPVTRTRLSFDDSNNDNEQSPTAMLRDNACARRTLKAIDAPSRGATLNSTQRGVADSFSSSASRR